MTSVVEPGGLVESFGFQVIEASTAGAVIEWTVREHHLQSHGSVHGGVLCAAVETAASLAAAQHSAGRVVGVSNTTNFVRAVGAGILRAVARPVCTGRSQQLWDVGVRDSDDRLVACGLVRLQGLDFDQEAERVSAPPV